MTHTYMVMHHALHARAQGTSDTWLTLPAAAAPIRVTHLVPINRLVLRRPSKVIYHLNTKNEDHELDLAELAEQYETEIEQVLKDTADKINHFKAQLDAANDAARLAQMQKVRARAALAGPPPLGTCACCCEIEGCSHCFCMHGCKVRMPGRTCTVLC